MIALTGPLVLLGGGKMGQALLEGWLDAGVPAPLLNVFDPAPAESLRLAAQVHGFAVNPDMTTIGDVAVVVVAVKPQGMAQVLAAYGALWKKHPLVISIVAGQTLALLAQGVGDLAIIRTMPNTPAAVGQGMTGMVPNENVTPPQLELAVSLLKAVGNVVQVPQEADLDSVTAVSGSGPAYVFYLTECLAQAGERAGLSPAVSQQLARQTVIGAAALLAATSEQASVLRQNVTSPKGVTQAGLDVLMHDTTGLGPLMQETVAAAAARSKALATP